MSLVDFMALTGSFVYFGQSNDCASLGSVDFAGVGGGGDCRKCYKVGGLV